MDELLPYQLTAEFRQKALSARMLEDFELCPRKFLLSHFLSWEEERRFRGGPAALHEAVRQALIECYERGGPSVCSLDILLESFAAHWRGELCADSLEEEQLYEQGRQMLQNYHADHCEDKAFVLATDLRMEHIMAGQSLVAVADVVLGGSADMGTDTASKLLCQKQTLTKSEKSFDEASAKMTSSQKKKRAHTGFQLSAEEIYVLRFVTSRRPLSAKELAEDLSAQMFRLLAHMHFCSAPSRGINSSQLHVLFYALRQRRAQELKLTSEQSAHVEHSLAIRLQRLYAEREFPPIKGTYCRWCRVRRRCPIWQKPEKMPQAPETM